MEYYDDPWGGEFGGPSVGDNYTDDEGNMYTWTGSYWGQTDTGGMGADQPTPEQQEEAYYRSIGIDPKSLSPEDKAAVKDLASKAGSTSVNAIKDAFKKADGSYDWLKIAAMAPVAASMFGLDKPETGGYKGSIPKLSAVRQQIEYDDTNRRPGSGGRQYFTDTQYAAKGADAAAKEIAASQAKGILAAYKPAEKEVDKWGADAKVPAVATPWAKKAADMGAPKGTVVPQVMTPEEKLAALSKMPWAKKEADRVAANPGENIITTPSEVDIPNPGEDTYEPWQMNPGNEDPAYSTYGEGPPTATKAAQGGIMQAAKGRYLQGPTDGMADKINTSIDNRQPAKLSHGEFVIPADVVSHLGNGNSDAGAKKLYSMMDKVRQARTGTKKQGKQINPDKYMPGGTVNKYAKGGIAQLPTKHFETGGATKAPAADTTTSGVLADWAGDYVTDYLGRGKAAAQTPYEAYKGPLTAGPSDLEKQAFAGASNLASTGLAPTQFTGGTWNTEEANKYMNPYLKNALDPQLEELRRQAQINLQGGLGKYAKMGGYGGGRQAILESEAMRNLLQEQNKTVGAGYKTAYDTAMDAYNKGRTQQLETEKAQQEANKTSAEFGLKSAQELAKMGATQREIEQAGLTADKNQFEEARDWDKKMIQYEQGLLQGLPITAQTNTQNMSMLTQLLANMGYGGQLADLLKKISGDTTATKSAGTP